eukprot:4765124-Amphidinium_carterae.1
MFTVTVKHVVEDGILKNTVEAACQALMWHSRACQFTHPSCGLAALLKEVPWHIAMHTSRCIEYMPESQEQ